MKQFLFTSALVMLLFSCSKKEAKPAPAPTNPVAPVSYNVSDYTKLTIGNYWIYKLVSVDTLGNVTPAGTDSCYVKNDSVINGNAYAVIMNAPYSAGITLERDSSNFLVNQHGNILFAYGDFNTVLYQDSIPYEASIKYSVSSVTSVVTVPMGTFTCYDYRGACTTIIPTDWGRLRYSHSYYALNVGLVESIQFYLAEPSTIQAWLIRAHVM